LIFYVTLLVDFYSSPLSTLSPHFHVVVTATESPPPSVSHVTCMDRLLVVTGNFPPSRMAVQVESTQTGNASAYIADIPDSHVSSACTQQPQSCNAVRVGPRYLAIPGNGSVVLVKSSDDYFVETVLGGACDPTALHYNAGTKLLSLVCSRAAGLIQVVLYIVDISEDGERLSLSFFSESENISSTAPGVRPYPVFVSDSPCDKPPLHVLVNNRVWQYQPDSNSLSPGPQLENCSSVESLTYVGGTNFIVYCSNQLASSYDICNGRWTPYPPSEGARIFPCAHNLTVHLGRNFVKLVDSSGAVLKEERHEVGVVTRGECSQKLMYVESADGVIYVSRLVPEQFLLRRLNMSIGRSRTLHLDSEGIVILSADDSAFFVISTVNDCQQLVVEKRMKSINGNILLPNTQFPNSQHQCSCAVSVGNHTSQPRPTTDSSRKVLSTGAVVGIAVALGLGLVVLIVLVVLSVTCFCKKRW